MKLLIPVFLAAALVANAAGNAYVGVKKCAMCHKGEKNGLVLEKWQDAKHADAFNDLASDRAKEIAKEMGVTGNPQEAADCLGCHTTGYGLDATLTAKLAPEDGVSCEACHGAGKNYAKKPIMKSHAKSVAKGMVDDPSKICVECHKEEVAHIGKFVYEERWEKITHSIPKK